MAVVREQLQALPQLSIRGMQEADVAAVSLIERSAYTFPWSEGIFHDCLRVRYICQVVEIGATLIGYGVMSVGAGEAHLLNVCVAQEYRCRGIGRRLLQHLLQLAARSGALDAFLEARPSNVAAVRLYASQGFFQIGVRRGYYQAVDGREDALVMKRRLVET
jgi:[ribosomal protein S18]-alanine N-acetyltransferase